MKPFVIVTLMLYSMLLTTCLHSRDHTYIEQYLQYKNQYQENDRGLGLQISLPGWVELSSDSILCQITLRNTTDAPILIKKLNTDHGSPDTPFEFLIEYPKESRFIAIGPRVRTDIIPERENFMPLDPNQEYSVSVDIKWNLFIPNPDTMVGIDSDEYFVFLPGEHRIRAQYRNFDCFLNYNRQIYPKIWIGQIESNEICFQLVGAQ